jgi:hypothetical protein
MGDLHEAYFHAHHVLLALLICWVWWNLSDRWRMSRMGEMDAELRERARRRAVLDIKRKAGTLTRADIAAEIRAASDEAMKLQLHVDTEYWREESQRRVDAALDRAAQVAADRAKDFRTFASTTQEIDSLVACVLEGVATAIRALKEEE